ncbi:MAG: GGDEF domain-containing protein [Gammaproteobacteria bacterium]|nr:GGDEF domain-containing protein [Gammaproteobacteria bacterium]
MKLFGNYSFRLTLALVMIFTVIGGITYQVIQESFQKKLESDALLLADLAVKQADVFRRVYVRDVIGKLKSDGFGADPHFLNKPGYIPISAQLVRMMAQEAKESLAEYEYKPVSKWNIGPYSIENDDFLSRGWEELETQQLNSQKNNSFEWQPIWEITQYRGTSYLRYMSAITASSNKCISCHLNFEQTDTIIERRKLQGIPPLTEIKPGQLLGAMSVDVPLENVKAFTQHETNRIITWLIVMFFVTLVSMIFYTQYVIRQRQHLQTMAWKAGHDKLTNLLNRRGFERMLMRSMEDVALGNSPFSICYIDLDGFKQVNDIHGHEAGDYVLKEIATILNSSVRSTDITSRLGGDEFIILYTQCSHDIAIKLANQLLEKIDAAELNWNGKPLSVSASMGVVEYDSVKHDEKSLMAQADSLCYQSKAKGKHQVT